MALPFEIWKVVAGYIPPNPLDYIRLASVNREFRQVFMADCLWEQLVVAPTNDCDYAAQYDASITVADRQNVFLVWQGFARGVSDECSRELLFAAAVCSAVEWPREGISHPLWENYGFAEKVLALDGYKFFYCGYDLRSSEELCHRALWSLPRGGPRKFGYAQPFEIVASKRNVLLALEKWGTSYMSNAPEQVRRDFDLMVAAAGMEPLSLLYIHPSLRLNRKFIEVCVGMYGPSIEFASYDLKSDLPLAELAVRQNGEAFKFLNEPLLDNTKLATIAVQTCAGAYEHMSPRLQRDENIIRAVVAQDPMLLRLMPFKQGERSFVLKLVKKNGWTLEFASQDLKDDTELVTQAVLRDAGSFQFASTRLREDEQMIALAAGRGARWVLDYAIFK